MPWILLVLFYAWFAVSGFRRAKTTGTWSWSLFFFALAFAGVETLILILPVLYLSNSSHFLISFIAAWVVAIGNFVWFIMVCRRWRLPDGRTNLEAAREQAAMDAQQNTRRKLPDLDRK
jgi:hypothetical protein